MEGTVSKRSQKPDSFISQELGSLVIVYMDVECIHLCPLGVFLRGRLGGRRRGLLLHSDQDVLTRCYCHYCRAGVPCRLGRSYMAKRKKKKESCANKDSSAPEHHRTNHPCITLGARWLRHGGRFKAH